MSVKKFKKGQLILFVLGTLGIAMLTSIAVNSAQSEISLDSPASLPSDI